jgi:hypothetical protein
MYRLNTLLYTRLRTRASRVYKSKAKHTKGAQKDPHAIIRAASPSPNMIMQRIAPAATGGIKNWFAHACSFCRETYDRTRTWTCHSCALIKVSSFFVRRCWPGAIYWLCVPPVCAENIKVVGCLTLGGAAVYVYMNNTDAVPSLKGHQQKPTYICGAWQQVARCIYFASTRALCAKLELAEISIVWLVFCSYIDVSWVYFMLYKRQYYSIKRKLISNCYYDLCDSIAGVSNHIVLTLSAPSLNDVCFFEYYQETRNVIWSERLAVKTLLSIVFLDKINNIIKCH